MRSDGWFALFALSDADFHQSNPTIDLSTIQRKRSNQYRQSTPSTSVFTSSQESEDDQIVLVRTPILEKQDCGARFGGCVHDAIFPMKMMVTRLNYFIECQAPAPASLHCHCIFKQVNTTAHRKSTTKHRSASLGSGREQGEQHGYSSHQRQKRETEKVSGPNPNSK